MSKLYTEEQVRIMLGKARLLNMDDTEMFTDDYLIEQQTPIQLPTADEILYESQGVFVNRIDMYEEGFIDGAEWVVNKIKGGQDERDRSIPE